VGEHEPLGQVGDGELVPGRPGQDRAEQPPLAEADGGRVGVVALGDQDDRRPPDVLGDQVARPLPAAVVVDADVIAEAVGEEPGPGGPEGLPEP
jgi:hypothetical protein